MTTGVVIVCCNTPGIITRAVNSIVDHVDSIVIVDNSDMGNECYNECDKLSKHEKVQVEHTGKNIGHGPGLNLGIEILKTDIVICMDSDCYVIDPSIIDEMKAGLGDGVYGSGEVTVEPVSWPYIPDWFHLHPYFCMFSKETFLKYKPFTNSGAPFKKTMISINQKLAVKNIESIKDKVIHEGKATRKVVKHWRKGFGGRSGI